VLSFARESEQLIEANGRAVPNGPPTNPWLASHACAKPAAPPFRRWIQAQAAPGLSVAASTV
jgi:hypothetical protein